MVRGLAPPDTDPLPSLPEYLTPSSLVDLKNYITTLETDEDAKEIMSRINQKNLGNAIEQFAESNNPFPYEDFEYLDLGEEIIDKIITNEIMKYKNKLYEVQKILEKGEIALKRDGTVRAKINPKDDKMTRTLRVNVPVDKKPTNFISGSSVSLAEEDLSIEPLLTKAYQQMVRTFGLGFQRKESLMPSIMKAIYARLLEVKSKSKNLVTTIEFFDKFNSAVQEMQRIIELDYGTKSFTGTIGEIARSKKRFLNKNLETFAYFIVYDDYGIDEENAEKIDSILNKKFILGDEEQTLKLILLRVYLQLYKMSEIVYEADETKEDLDSGELKLSMEFLKADISSLDEDRRREIKTILQNSHPTEYFGEDYLKLGKLINILGDVADTDEETLLEELGVENLQMVKKAAALRKIYERLYRTLRDIVYEEE